MSQKGAILFFKYIVYCVKLGIPYHQIEKIIFESTAVF